MDSRISKLQESRREEIRDGSSGAIIKFTANGPRTDCFVLGGHEMAV